MKTRIISLLLALSLPMAVSAAGWAPANKTLKTPWTSKVSPKNVHKEYPRPQMVRSDWQSLNGLWDYSITPSSENKAGSTMGQILVPFPIESSLSGVGSPLKPEDALWYTRTFKVPGSWKNKKVLLHFDAVDWGCEVIVNGVKVGSHTGGYTAFDFNITQYLQKDELQTITVKVIDGTDNNFQPRGKQVLNPRGIWYTAVSGIWQSVWIEAVSKDAYIQDYKIASDIHRGTVTVTPECVGTKSGDVVKVEVLEGKVGYSAEKPSKKVIASASAAAGTPVTVEIPDAQLWSPDDPFLYGLKISVVRKNKTLDKVQAYTALRQVAPIYGTTGKKRIGLNEKPLFNYGPLDQGWWPDGLYTAPTDAALKYDIVKTKELGFNMIRKHVKVEPSRWYYYCDVLGMMVWQDMPSTADNDMNSWVTTSYGGTDTPVSEECKENFRKEWGEIINQLDKFQCITVWVPFNEAWGQFDTADIVAFTRSKDSSRLINAASGGNFVKGAGDILDAHTYPEPWPAMYDPEMISVIGEYGGIGLPVKNHLWQKDKNWGYVEYRDGKEVTDKYVEFTEHLIVQLEEKGSSAAVYTQTTDVEGEVNGLMTYDRKVLKVDAVRIAEANKRVIAEMK